MKIRLKSTGEEGSASSFNAHALSEVYGYFKDWTDTLFMSDLDVFIPSIGWKDMGQAFRDHDLITDNFNTCFFEPKTAQERERGYVL